MFCVEQPYMSTMYSKYLSTAWQGNNVLGIICLFIYVRVCLRLLYIAKIVIHYR